MTMINSKLKRQITEDWRRLFPQMAEYRPLWLARRVGPLVQGICLEPDSLNRAYFPTTYLHNLCRPFPVISLSLAQRLLSEHSRTQERIPVQLHEERYRAAGKRLAQACVLPLNGDLTVQQVLAAHHTYRGLNRPDSKYPLLLFEDGIVLCAWSGQRERAMELLDCYNREACDWPLQIMARYGGVNAWKQKMLETIQASAQLKAVPDSQACQLGAAELPSAQLLG